MKAVFITRGCLMREATADGLSQETRTALQTLAEIGLYTILLGTGPDDGDRPERPADGALTQQWVERVRAAGGRIDAVMHCPHTAGETCFCWGAYPGFLVQASRDLDLHLDESYILCDSPADVALAYAAGCRQILILNGRTIDGLYDGRQPEPADFPIARNFSRAVDYLLCEEQLAVELGHSRPPSATVALEEGDGRFAYPESLPAGALPTLTAFTAVPSPERERPAQVIRYGGRWLLLIVLGGVWLSLGIAYLLTHLYRVHPFPEFVYYLTLQFVPRPVRGALFILTGVLALFVALRSVREMLPTAVRWGKDQHE